MEWKSGCGLHSSLEIFDDITFFKVGNYSPFVSEHRPIFYEMQLRHYPRENTEVKLNDSPKIFCFNNQDKQKFSEIINSPEIATKLATLNAINSPDPQDLASEISNTLMDACSKAGIKPKKKPPISGGDEPWYDHECQKLKKKFFKEEM